jgi:hypothetical protein
MHATQLAKLSHEAAIHALDLQERGVEQLRARTGTLLAASSLTASFLGAQAIRRGSSIGTLAAFALVALACSIVLCIYVLLPKSDFVFEISPSRMYESLFEVAEDESEVHRHLAYWLEDFWRANQAKIDILGRYFLVAAMALILQLAFWSWALAASIS